VTMAPHGKKFGAHTLVFSDGNVLSPFIWLSPGARRADRCQHFCHDELLLSSMSGARQRLIIHSGKSAQDFYVRNCRSTDIEPVSWKISDCVVLRLELKRFTILNFMTRMSFSIATAS
jgi:hypothetical protein